MKLSLLLFIILLSSCSEHKELLQESEIVSDFDWTVQGNCSSPVFEILFENKSIGAAEFLWDFGDGTRSNEINPKKTYSKAGAYNVTLTASSVSGSRQTAKNISVVRNSDGNGPTASLTVSRDSDNNLELNFVVLTSQFSYKLDFGDGVVETFNSTQSVSHRYAARGIYHVTVIVQNEDGQNCSNLVLTL